jgi:catechol 2,3-dioxygenase-like lactoylglutathione lyase family enzyme
MFRGVAFVAITAADLARARRFWVESLGFPVVEEEPGEYVMVDAAGLRLCIDREDGETHRAGGGDPVVGLRVADLEATLAALRARGVAPEHGPERGRRGSWARLRDPDGHAVVLTEQD